MQEMWFKLPYGIIRIQTYSSRSTIISLACVPPE